MYEQTTCCEYHIFGDGWDEYFYDQDDVALLNCLEEKLKEGKENIRIYKSTKWDEEEGVYKDGDCIFSIGSWPN